MRCTTARTVMIASLDGVASEVEQRDLAAHIDGCSDCRREEEKTRRLALALERLGSEAAVPAALESAVLRRVRDLAADRPAWPARLRAWLPTPVLAAAAAVVAITLVVDLGDRGPTGEDVGAVARPRPIEAPPTRVATAETPREGALPGAGRDAASVRVANDTGAAPPSEPPAELAESIPLLLDLPILRNMEKLEHYDSIAALAADDDPKTDEQGTSG